MCLPPRRDEDIALSFVVTKHDVCSNMALLHVSVPEKTRLHSMGRLDREAVPRKVLRSMLGEPQTVTKVPQTRAISNDVDGPDW
jgi:hypothetical protein